MSEPALSIIIPVFNRAAMLGDALSSALAVPVEAEVIVVDDASTDHTWEALQRFTDPRVRPLRMQTNSGQSAARNAGLDIARARYVKFLDSDDLLLGEHVSAEIAALDRGADIAASGWIEEQADGTRTSFDAPRFDSIVDDVLAGRAVPTSAATYRRRSDWRWDPALRKLDDWAYFALAALGANQIASVAGAAYVMRHHGGARATDATLLMNAREHHHILRAIERSLATSNRLTPARARRLAQYFYKELRVLSLHDRDAFERALQHIYELDPQFRPRDEEQQRFMRILTRVFGVRRVLMLHSALKRMLRHPLV